MAERPVANALIRELEPVVDANLVRHIDTVDPWFAHDYVPFGDGRNFAALGGEDWEPGQSPLSEVARIAMITNLLTEDNLPSYHRTIADNFSRCSRHAGLAKTAVSRMNSQASRLPGALSAAMVSNRVSWASGGR